MRSKGAVAVASALVVALVAGGPTEAKRKINPKAGGYIGKVTNKNGRDGVQLSVATFVPEPGAKPRKGPQLFNWSAVLKCDDGMTREAGPGVFAPLKGAKFRGKSKVGPTTTTLHGRFTANTKLEGTARVVTRGSAPATKCDSGPVTFKAHRR